MAAAADRPGVRVILVVGVVDIPRLRSRFPLVKRILLRWVAQAEGAPTRRMAALPLLRDWVVRLRQAAARLATVAALAALDLLQMAATAAPIVHPVVVVVVVAAAAMAVMVRLPAVPAVRVQTGAAPVEQVERAPAPEWLGRSRAAAAAQGVIQEVAQEEPQGR